MHPINIKYLSRATLTALLLSIGGLATATPAHAYDDDVDFVCGENDDGTDWCVSVEELRAECPLLDPDNETELCAGLNENRRTPQGLKTFEARSGMKTIPLSQVTSFKKK